MEIISVITPVYNEEETLPVFYSRLVTQMNRLEISYEVIMVNDGSHDRSLEIMKDIHEKNNNVKVIDLSRNFGHQAAISAGIDHAIGDVVIIMDSDLQDPPEVLPLLVDRIIDGYDVVYAVRKKRKEGIVKRSCYSLFYRLLRAIGNIDIPIDSGDFCAMSKRAAHLLKAMPERNPFLRGLRAWIGLKQTGVEYEREERFAGDAKYSFVQLLKLSFDGIISFSSVPLRLVSILGVVISSMSFIAGIIVLYLHYFTDLTASVPGWTSMLLAVFFLGGIQLLSHGITGEYILRIYDDVKQRPKYIVNEYIGINESSVPR